MARILTLNYQKTEVECDCGNDEVSGFVCDKCGKFYEAVFEHMLKSMY